jgi:glycosyltransferase involved in cell wall biosynthesis
MNKVRLFYAVPDFFPPWRSDVSELFVEQLPLRGFDVTWSARIKGANRKLFSRHKGQAFLLPPQLPGGGLPAKAANKLLQYVFEVAVLIALLLGRRFDIIQIRDRRYFFSFFARLIAWIRGATFVYWCSYPFPESLIEQSGSLSGIRKITASLRGRLSFLYLYKVILPLSDHIFVQSEQMKTDLSSYGIAPGKMTPVPMGVPASLLDTFASRANTAVTPGKIVYLGTFAAVRRLEVIIQAFAQVVSKHPHARLYMVGAGDVPAEKALLEQTAENLGIQDYVIFTGFLPMADAMAHAASSDICLSPFYPTFVLRSTSPTKLVEYLALGKPVVANDHPEQAEIIKQSGSGLCVPWGDRTFAEAMDSLLSDPEMTRSMGLKGPAWVASNRTYDLIANGVAQKYRDILSKHATTP